MLFKADFLKEIMDCCYIGEEFDGAILEDMGDWVSEGKYDFCWWVFCFDGKFYMVTDSRSGSYFSDYYYESNDWGEMVDCDEVERIEVKKYEWIPCKNDINLMKAPSHA